MNISFRIVLILIFLLGTFSPTSSAQNCPASDVYISTQSDLDNFAQTFPSCNVILGDLVLNAGGSDPVTDLSGLSGITQVDGNVFMSTILTDLTMPNLVTVGGLLQIHENASQSISFPNLQSVGSLYLEYNFDLSSVSLPSLSGSIASLVIEGTGLTDLNFTANFTSITSGLFLKDNSDLVSISGLSFTSFSGNVTIQGNTSLSTCGDPAICLALENAGLSSVSNNGFSCNTAAEINAQCGTSNVCPSGNLILQSQSDVDDFGILFPNCTVVDGYLIIDGNSSSDPITDLSGVSGIEQVNQSLEITGNISTVSLPNLHSVNAINFQDAPNLSSIFIPNLSSDLESLKLDNLGLSDLNFLSAYSGSVQSMDISYNASLTDISGVSNLVLTDDFKISYNPLLDTCGYPSICLGINTVNNVQVYGNAAGCISPVVIGISCGNPPLDCNGQTFGFFTQTDIDVFSILYPNCTTIGGDLVIEANDSSDPITSLAGLSGITSVGGDLSVSFFSGQFTLPNLELVGGVLEFENNNFLSSISIPILQSTGSIRFVGNGNLNNVSIPNLSGTLSGLSIDYTDLVNLDFLSGISSLTTVLRLVGNSELTNLDGIANTDLSGGLFIHSNPNLAPCIYESICVGLASGAITSTFVLSNGGCSIGSNYIQNSCGTLTEICLFVATVGDWDSPNNWSGGVLPNQDCAVYIFENSNCTIQGGTNVQCESLTVEEGAIMNIYSASNIEVFGD